MRDKSHKIYLNRCRKSIDKLNTHFWCLKHNLSKQDIENFNLIKKPPVGLYALLDEILNIFHTIKNKAKTNV